MESGFKRKKIKKICKNFDIEVKYKKNLKKLELNRGLKIHKNKDNIPIRVCPNCGSDKLEKFDELRLPIDSGRVDN